MNNRKRRQNQTPREKAGMLGHAVAEVVNGTLDNCIKIKAITNRLAPLLEALQADGENVAPAVLESTLDQLRRGVRDIAILNGGHYVETAGRGIEIEALSKEIASSPFTPKQSSSFDHELWETVSDWVDRRESSRVSGHQPPPLFDALSRIAKKAEASARRNYKRKKESQNPFSGFGSFS